MFFSISLQKFFDSLESTVKFRRLFLFFVIRWHLLSYLLIKENCLNSLLTYFIVHVLYNNLYVRYLHIVFPPPPSFLHNPFSLLRVTIVFSCPCLLPLDLPIHSFNYNVFDIYVWINLKNFLQSKKFSVWRYFINNIIMQKPNYCKFLHYTYFYYLVYLPIILYWNILII